jgi:hypothetical protein
MNILKLLNFALYMFSCNLNTYYYMYVDSYSINIFNHVFELV